jgi:hypothetical protein
MLRILLVKISLKAGNNVEIKTNQRLKFRRIWWKKWRNKFVYAENHRHYDFYINHHQHERPMLLYSQHECRSFNLCESPDMLSATLSLATVSDGLLDSEWSYPSCWQVQKSVNHLPPSDDLPNSRLSYPACWQVQKSVNHLPPSDDLPISRLSYPACWQVQ